MKRIFIIIFCIHLTSNLFGAAFPEHDEQARAAGKKSAVLLESILADKNSELLKFPIIDRIKKAILNELSQALNLYKQSFNEKSRFPDQDNDLAYSYLRFAHFIAQENNKDLADYINNSILGPIETPYNRATDRAQALANYFMYNDTFESLDRGRTRILLQRAYPRYETLAESDRTAVTDEDISRVERYITHAKVIAANYPALLAYFNRYLPNFAERIKEKSIPPVENVAPTNMLQEVAVHNVQQEAAVPITNAPEEAIDIAAIRESIENARHILNAAPTENTAIALEFLEHLQRSITQGSATHAALQTASDELNSFDENFKAMEIPYWQEAYEVLFNTILEELAKTPVQADITPLQAAASPQAIAQSEVLIQVPADIAALTALHQVNLNLDEEEALSGGETFRNLIDDKAKDNDQKTLTLVFSQDAQGRWFSYFFDEEEVPLGPNNPITRAPIAYRTPITIRKAGDRYEQEQETQ